MHSSLKQAGSAVLNVPAHAVSEPVSLPEFDERATIQSLGNIEIPDGASIEVLRDKCTKMGTITRKARENITLRRFPEIETGFSKIALICCCLPKGPDDIINRMANLANQELLSIEWLLALGAHPHYRQLVLQFPIYCLKTVVKHENMEYYAALDRELSQPKLMADQWAGYRLPAHVRILVREN